MMPSHLEAGSESEYVGTEEIDIRRLDSVLDDIFGSDERIYLKIDTRGYEKRVLDGAEKVLRFVDVLELEMSLIPLYKDRLLFYAMHDYLYEKGHVLVYIDPSFTDPSTGQILQMDCIFQKPRLKPSP